MDLPGDTDQRATITLHLEEGAESAIVTLEMEEVLRDSEKIRAEGELEVSPTPKGLIAASSQSVV